MILAEIIIAAVVARASVVALFPPAARLYSMVGLAVPPPGAGLDTWLLDRLFGRR